MAWWKLTGLLLAVLAVLLWLAVEVHRFFRGRSVISGVHLALRGLVAVLLMTVVGMMIWGAYYPWTKEQAWHQLGYWTVCLALVFVVMLLTMRDWRMVVRERHLKRAELYRKMDEELGTPREPAAKKED